MRGSEVIRHWNETYESSAIDSLGWYEESPGMSLRLLDLVEIGVRDAIVDVGAGAGTFVHELVRRGFANVTAMDISNVALERARQLSPGRTSDVKWVVDDVTAPRHMDELAGKVSVWHDRAVLHFMCTAGERDGYRSTLDRLVAAGGYVIIAAFSLDGVDRCSGLEVVRYDAPALEAYVGPRYRLLHAFDHLYVTPGGEPRPYVYTLFQAENS